MWTVEPAIVQLPLAANVTVKLDDAVALTAKSASPKIFAPSAPNVIVWLPLAMENVCGTSGAGLKVPWPACEAVMVQEPAPGIWTVEPTTVQLPLAANGTARLE